MDFSITLLVVAHSNTITGTKMTLALFFHERVSASDYHLYFCLPYCASLRFLFQSSAERFLLATKITTVNVTAPIYRKLILLKARISRPPLSARNWALFFFY